MRTVSCKGWNFVTDVVCLHALHFTADCLSPVVLWMNREVMVVGSEQWISEAVLAVAVGVPVPVPFVAVAVEIALLAMVTTASTLHLLLEATQSIKRSMWRMAVSSTEEAAAVAGMAMHDMAAVLAVLERFLSLSGGCRVKEVQDLNSMSGGTKQGNPEEWGCEEGAKVQNLTHGDGQESFPEG